MPAQPPIGDVEGNRQRNADRTRAEILEVATTEFAREGFAGARVDEIAARTSTTKRMIYYYFGGKEQLYIAVLENALAQIGPDALIPVGASLDALSLIRQIAQRTYTQAQEHPDLIRLVIAENLYTARYLNESMHFHSIRKLSFDVVEHTLADGARRGAIRAGIRAADIFMIINSFCTYRIANRYTFQHLTDCDLLDPADEEHQRRVLDDLLTSYLSPLR